MKTYLILMLLLNVSLFGASFDCAKAKTDVEKMICANPELSALDENLSNAFKEAMRESSDKGKLKKEQFAWVKERNQCKERACVQKTYASRIVDLNASRNQNQSQFIGTWCSNPCLYGSRSRPWDMPCEFVVSKNSITWSQWDSGEEFIRKYTIVEQKEGEETMLIYGGNANSWYSHPSTPNTKHRLLWSTHYSNEYAQKKGSIEFREENWNERDKKWIDGGSMYVTRSTGGCL